MVEMGGNSFLLSCGKPMSDMVLINVQTMFYEVAECSDQLGMENGGIGDNQLSSTAQWARGKVNCGKEIHVY